MDPLITAGNNATANVTDNNVGQTQTDNASYASANPNTFGTQNSTQPVVMTPTQAFNNNPISVPTITAPDTSGAIVAGANSTVDSISKSLTPAPTPLDNQQQGLLNDIANLTGTDGGKGDEAAALNDKYGVNTDQQDLVNAQNELASKTAHYNQLQANLGGNNSVETSAVLAAQNSGLLKAQAADIGITNAKITAAQGNLKLAQDQVANAIALKYGDIEAQIKTKQAQLDALMPSLTKQQQTQATAQQELLKKQDQKVAEEKATATSNVQMAVTAGVNTKFVNKNGQFFDTNTGVPFATPEDFFKAAGVSSFPEAYEKGLVSDLNNQKMQDINFAQQAQAKYPDVKIPANSTPEQVQQIIKGSRIYQKETYIAKPASSPSSPSNNPITTVSGGNVVAGVTLPSNVSASDVQAVLEGRETALDIRQTVGKSKEGDAKMQALRDAIFKIDPKFDFVASNAGGKLVSSTYYQKSQAAINSVLPNIDKVVDLSNQVSRVGVAGVDKILQAGKIQIGNTKVANFHEAQKLIADEIGLALGAGSVSDMKLQLGFDVTDPSVSPEVFASNMGIVKEFIQNRKNGLEQQRYQSSTVNGGNSPSDSSQPQQMNYNGKILNLQPDGTYQ